MRKRPIAAAAAIVAAGLAIAGAAAPPAPSESTSVSAAVEEFVATGVLPTDVSGDPGIWNYAGPAGTCPGPGWICVTLGMLPITQIGTVNVIQCVGISCVGSTQSGYANTFQCQPAPDVTFQTNTDVLQACGISQTGESNQAKCEQKKKTVPFVRQRCSITQSGRDNQATIVQVVDQTDGSTQGALQEAGVSQSATGSNQLQIHQELQQQTQTGLTQDQDAYQVVSGPFVESGSPTGSATQTAVGAGGNQAQINQKQTQRAKDGTTQTQNDGIFANKPAPVDCHEFLFSPAEPNACANLEQVSESGSNQSQLTQAIDEEATASVVAAQTQGSLDGGLDGRVHQVTAAPGSSKNQASQSKKQVLFGPPGSTQSQFDPGGCCGFGSVIGPGSEAIAQGSEQVASEGEALQTLILWGTSSAPAGNCGISHNAKNNADQTSESFSFEPCFPVLVQTTCTSGPEDIIFIAQVGQCTTTETDPFDD